MIISSSWMNKNQQAYLFSAHVVHVLRISLKSSPRNRVHQTYPIWSHPDVAVGIGSELGQVLGHLVGSLEGRSIFSDFKTGPQKIGTKKSWIQDQTKTKPRFLRWVSRPWFYSSLKERKSRCSLVQPTSFTVSWFHWIRWAMKLSSPYNWPTATG